MWPGGSPMIAHIIPPGPNAGQWICWQQEPLSPFTINWSPGSVPVFVHFVPRNTPHFPYGYPVDPD